MNKTTMQAMKAIKLSTSVRHDMGCELLNAARDSFEEWRRTEDGDNKRAKELGNAVYKMVRREIPKKVLDLLKDEKAAVYLTLNDTVQVQLPEESIPEEDRPYCNVHTMYDAVLPASLPLDRRGSYFKTIRLTNYPDSPARRHAIKLMLDTTKRVVAYRRDVYTIETLTGYSWNSVRKLRCNTRTLYDLYCAWPALAAEYCRRVGITLPTDANSEEVLADIKNKKSTALAVMEGKPLNWTALEELAKRLHLPYKVGKTKE